LGLRAKSGSERDRNLLHWHRSLHEHLLDCGL
jgi:hypothetical protein